MRAKRTREITLFVKPGDKETLDWEDERQIFPEKSDGRQSVTGAVLDECTHKKKGVRNDWRHCMEDLRSDAIGRIDVTHNHRLDLVSAVNEHAHPMPCWLVARTVVGQNERKIHRVFVYIRNKIPLLLGLIMDFVSTGAGVAELEKKRGGQRHTERGMQILHTCFGESSVEESEDDCSRRVGQWAGNKFTRARSSPMGWALNET